MVVIIRTTLERCRIFFWCFLFAFGLFNYRYYVQPLYIFLCNGGHHGPYGNFHYQEVHQGNLLYMCERNFFLYYFFSFIVRCSIVSDVFKTSSQSLHLRENHACFCCCQMSNGCIKNNHTRFACLFFM